jgi:hypothetical protein
MTTENVPFDFLMANQTVAALETRAAYLAATRDPMDLVTLRAIRSCVAASDALRAAFHFPTEPELDAAHEASVAEMDELADVEAYPGETEDTAHEAALWKRGAPLAENELRALHGDR